jgi:hypothetical protein
MLNSLQAPSAGRAHGAACSAFDAAETGAGSYEVSPNAPSPVPGAHHGVTRSAFDALETGAGSKGICSIRSKPCPRGAPWSNTFRLRRPRDGGWEQGDMLNSLQAPSPGRAHGAARFAFDAPETGAGSKGICSIRSKPRPRGAPWSSRSSAAPTPPGPPQYPPRGAARWLHRRRRGPGSAGSRAGRPGRRLARAAAGRGGGPGRMRARRR